MLLFGLLALAGALLNLSLPPLGLWVFALALVPLVILVANAEHAKEAFGFGFGFALGFFTLHLLWLPLSFVELFGAVAWIIYPPLILILAAMWGLVSWISRRLGGAGTGTLWLLPAVWVLLEWIRAQGYFAFPWGFLGYIWTATPLAQLADLSGVYGLSFLTTLLAALFAAPFVHRQRYASKSGLLPVTVALGLLVLTLAYSGHRLGMVLPEPKLEALLVQGNTNPLTRAVGEEEELERYLRLTEEALIGNATPPDVIIWPEGAIPELGWFPLSQEASRQIHEVSPASPVVTGGAAFEGNLRFNSIFSVTGNRIADRYDKVYLVPFGETWPLMHAITPLYQTVFGWFGLPLLQNTSSGTGITPLTFGATVTAAYICYESVFPQVARRMVRDGAHVLTNVSNDAWFGRGLGAQQHFLMGTMRAIETRRYLLRVGNDGITAVIDPLGRVRAELPRHVQATLRASYDLRMDPSPYVRWGDWLILVLALYALGFTGTRLLFR